MKVDFSVYQNLHWIIGFSGGADSRLLLELASLNRHYALSIKAIYVHHHLQSVADEWALICKNECTKLGVDFLVEHVTVPLKGSIEANAREARYNAFAKYMTPNTVLFTAHHADDLLENELLALIRGAGINGLSSMPKFRRFAQGFLARPLLSLARSEIVKECAIRGLLYVTDPTNSDCAYDRNFLRSQITPLLKERFPQILSSIIKVQENLTHEKDSYEELLSKELENIRSANAYLEGISFKKISTYSLNLQRELLRFFLKKAYNIIANRDELGQILKFGKLGSDNKAECYLVEVIAKSSQNIVWKVSLDGERMENQRIRRVSMDKFYEIVTGDKEAFYKICMELPALIDEIIEENKELQVGSDTVVDELREKNPDLLKALYLLAFKEYEGFKNLK